MIATSTEGLSSQKVKQVSIRPGVSVLAVLRHLNYTPWFALAEFVDNALQSFNENNMALAAPHGDGLRLCALDCVDLAAWLSRLASEQAAILPPRR
jgi:hypothetical protein